MENSNAVVATVIRIEPPLDRPPDELLRAAPGLSVQLEGERRVPLDPDDPRSAGFAQILDGLRRQRLPVYLEVDPATSAITRLLIPHVTRVVGIRPIDYGMLGVELELSHARHVLRRSSPDFGELEQRLREAMRTGAPVILTENDAHEIIDIRSYTPGPEGLPPPFDEPRVPPRVPLPWRWIRAVLDLMWRWRWWPGWWLRYMSATRAQQIFDAMSATSCDPLTVPAPCIPFLYPDNGCWTRAHEMCRLMINMGLKPKKVWILGNLNVSTKNNPNCGVRWGWHVAPALYVPYPDVLGFLFIQDMVIDPSLFTTPVSKATWKGVQGDPTATLIDKDASDYLWGDIDPNFDPTYSRTNYHLARFRLDLLRRAVQEGPPPYANCP